MPRDLVYPRAARALDSLATPLPGDAELRVAISGGPDSTALLCLCARYRERRRPDLVLSAGHIRHGLRGTAEDDDAGQCRELAATLGVACVEERIDVPEHAARHRMSVETAGRELRRAVFRRWGTEGITSVATGHTARDQLETVLGNLLRGTGVTGLGGIHGERWLPGNPAVQLVRPLLGIGRHELEEWLAARGVSARHDPSNLDPAHRRNRLRHELIPLLMERFNPRLERALIGLAGEARELMALRDALLEPAASALHASRHVGSLPLRSVHDLGHGALTSALLDRLWQQVAVPERPAGSGGLARDHHDAWRRMVEGESAGTVYELPGGWRLERSGGWVHLLDGAALESDDWRAPVADTTPLTALRAHLHLDDGEPPGSVALAAQWLGADAHLRPARRGDRLPIESGHADVMELLRAAGVPPSCRTRYPVLVASDGTPRWLPGVRTAPTGPGPRQHALVRIGTAITPTAFTLARLLRP